MLLLIRQISLPELRKHPLRYVLTFVAVVLGVAIFSASRTANASLKTALRDTIDRIAGKAVLQVSAGEAGVREEILEAVRGVPGVRTAVPVIEAVVRTAEASQGNILILGVDMTGDRGLRDYALDGQEEAVSDPLVFLAQPDSLLVSREFAARNRLAEGDPVALATALGKKTFTVRGIMAPRGVAQAFGGNIGVMDIYSAQFVFGRGRTFDRIDVALEEGHTVDQVQARLGQALGAAFRVEPPLRRGRQTESLMEAFALAYMASSLMALLVGVFLIFNAFSVSVAQRRTEIGILRALGVTRGQVRALFLGESALLGLVGATLGALGGVFLGRGMMMFMAAVVYQTYGVHVSVDRLRVDTPWVVLSVIVGVAASLVGAIVPAQAAAAVDPAQALQKGRFQVAALGEHGRRRWAGLGFLAVSLALHASARSVPLQLLGQAALIAGLTLLVPTFSHALTGLLRHPMGWLFGLEGRLASDSLLRSPRRTSATVGALMFSLALVVSSASLSVSVKTSMLRWVDSAVNPDLIVSASENLMARTFQFPEEMADELRKVPGVRQVDSLRMVGLNDGTRAPLLLSMEIDQYLARSRPLLEQGRVDDLVPAMLDRNAALVSNNYARLRGLGKGDRIGLDTPSGRQDVEIVGVQVDYTSDSGTVFVDRRTFKRWWKDGRVDAFELMLEPGRDVEAVRGEINRRFAGVRSVFVLTNADFRGEVLRLANQFWVLTYVQTLVAVAVGVLGIVNSLTVSIAERKREIGILRALGGERRRVRKAIVLEAMVMGVVAVVLGTLVGSTLGYYVIDTASAAVTGWTFPYAFPWAAVAIMAPLAALFCAAAAWYPSSLALKTPLVEALAYE